MNEWIMVGGILIGTVTLLGGGGWIASLVRRKPKGRPRIDDE